MVPEPAVVVATDRQLDDVRFCTASTEFSILTVDPTFNVGDFDITVATYRHLLSRKTHKPPVFIGPV